MKVKKAKFKVSWLPGEYEGYYFDEAGETFNGEPIPYFSLDIVTMILRDISAVVPEQIENEYGYLDVYPLGKEAWQWIKVEQ